jgi:hypothetical protein
MIGLLVKGSVPELEVMLPELSERTGIDMFNLHFVHSLSKEHETFMTVPDLYDTLVARWFGKSSCSPYPIGELLFFIRGWKFAER